MPTATAIVLRVNPSADRRLEDNAQWQNRFQIKSASSDSLYTIAQHKSGRYWGCNCPGWIRHKKCKHLEALGLPGYMHPFEATLPAPESR
jgi:hypothetical protein